jgi:hypothetical protein
MKIFSILCIERYPIGLAKHSMVPARERLNITPQKYTITKGETQ